MKGAHVLELAALHVDRYSTRGVLYYSSPDSGLRTTCTVPILRNNKNTAGSSMLLVDWYCNAAKQKDSHSSLAFELHVLHPSIEDTTDETHLSLSICWICVCHSIRIA
jgi:hypothetical protein